MKTFSLMCTCRTWHWCASSWKTTTSCPKTSLLDSTHFHSTAWKWVSAAACNGSLQLAFVWFFCPRCDYMIQTTDGSLFAHLNKWTEWNYPLIHRAQRTQFTCGTKSSSYFCFSDHSLHPLCSHTGYRHVPLLSRNGDLLPSAGLFLHIMVLDAE